jgi:ABC-type nickel/cobalt efflux system permease component RcnA
MSPGDLSLLNRIAESSPVVVLILTVACTVLWRTLREEMREWRNIAAANSEAVHALTVAVDRLREKIDGP